jgi:hypothetical protein
MESIKQLLKDYGPAIGPALAFVLSFCAFFAKDAADRMISKWSLARRLRHLEILLSTYAPPKTFFSSPSGESKLGDSLRNRTNLARFYIRLLALKPVFEALNGPVAGFGSYQQLARFYGMKWWFDLVLNDVESWRSDADFEMTSGHFDHLSEYWERLRSAATNPDAQIEYISKWPD